MKPQIKAIYLSVKDMTRAVKFYEDIFDKKALSFDKRMSVFAFDNISFLLFDPSIDGDKISIGNNVVPNIEVEDATKMFKYAKDKGCNIVMSLEKVGKYFIFQVKDTEGNIIEFYQVKT